MEQTVQEQNKMIAEFMGKSVELLGGYRWIKYHSSWDWLMEVKITTMDHGSYGITLDPHGIEIRDYSEENKR